MAYEATGGIWAHGAMPAQRKPPRTGRGGRAPKRDAGRGPRMAARAVAVALAAVVAVSFSCAPLAFARTGVTGNMDADMVYYWSSSQSHSSHQVHLLDSDWTYCVDPYHGYTAGLTYTSEDPVKTGKLSQECVTDMALAYKYVWEENLYTTPAGTKLKNDYERYAAAQVLIWTILVDYYPSLGPHHNRITVKGVDITGDGNEDDNNKKAYRWIAAHRNDYIGHCLYFDAGSHQSFAMEFFAEPLTGAITLKKASANASLTAGNSNYSLAGARYGVYKDKACTSSAGVLVTDESGAAKADDMPIGTYYVKETKAPAGFELDDAVYEVAVASGKTVAVNGAKGLKDTPKTGSLGLQKKSADQAMTQGNDNYSLAGAVYTAYSDSACKTKVVALTTDSSGAASADGLALGTYYVKETTAPDGYELDAKTYEVTVKAGKTAYVNGSAGVAEQPKSGSIGLRKVSANEQITKGNGCYTLKGARYGVFRDGACTSKYSELATDSDGKAQLDKVPLGTYYVKELAAPAGYALDSSVRPVKVAAGKVVYVGTDDVVADVPQAGLAEVGALKADAQTADGRAQGSATLAGAQFTVAYYDGYYDLGSLPASPVRSWVISTDEAGRARMADGSRVGGDEFYRNAAGSVVVPLGTVVVRETAAPAGYRLGNGADDEGLVQVCQIKADGTTATSVTPLQPLSAVDQVQRGGVMVGKVDRQNGQHAAQGSATLAGATLQIVSDNDQRVVVDGVEYVKGAVVKTLETELVDGRFVAQTAADCLPVGTYTVTETGTSEGYLLDEESRAWSRQFTVESDGHVVDLTQPGDAVSNLVIRGDFEFSKVDGASAERLGNVAFMVTSKTTGEAHVIVTDENGMASTAAGWNSHASATNANDEAVVENDGELAVDEEKLDAHAGIWFSGTADFACDPDDDLGALPFDTYTVNELRSAANEGLDLVSFETVISRNARELDLGTVSDNAGPAIGTSLADGNGAKLVPESGEATLVDTVSFANLKPGQHYQVQGELHAVDAEGASAGVVATGSAEFDAKSAAGQVEVLFAFDAAQAGAGKLVATERLLDAQGNVACSHEDLTDEGQTVTVPHIATELHAPVGSSTASAVGTVELTDTVAYEGLVPGRTYTMQAELHVRGDDGADAGPAKDAAGGAIVARQSFTPAQAEGTVDVTFQFEPGQTAGQVLVAFEELTFRDVTYATHADIADEAQSVRMPALNTTFAGADGLKEVDDAKELQLIDRVNYRNLVAGGRYGILGTLHVMQDGEDLGELKDQMGNPVSAKTMFTADEADGSADVSFAVNAQDLGGRSLVAFEVLTDENENVITTHEDIRNEAQTINVKKSPEPEKPATPEEAEAPTPDAPKPEEPTKPDAPKTATAAKTPAPKTTAKTTRASAPAARTVAKTGDELGRAMTLLVPAALAGIAMAAIAVRQMRRSAPVTIQRGPAHAQSRTVSPVRTGRPAGKQPAGNAPKGNRNPIGAPRAVAGRPSAQGRRGAHRR